MRVALWAIDQGQPRRLEQRRDFLELDLEDWIQAHPQLAVDGMTWVARQLVLPDRSRLDLVGVTREGQIVIAELKRGTVDVATLTQAMHYVLAIAAWGKENFLKRLTLDDDTRDLLLAQDGDAAIDMAVLLVGTARAPELDRAAAFLSDRGLNLPVRIVTFAPFIDLAGNVVLAREVEEHEQQSDDTTPRQRSSRAARIEWIQERARELRVNEVVEKALTLSSELGLNVKPWPRALTIVPPFTRGRTLIYLAPWTDGYVRFGYSGENLAALYGASESEVEERLGENWVELDGADASRRLDDFTELMTQLLAPDDGDDDGAPLIPAQ
ncbi:MAG TPA: endonuclease NucS domain-containing protein [Chloroflexota bacterium]|nr:endonuclease NucS domain-containing protein [Chloroflexota bacterium]